MQKQQEVPGTTLTASTPTSTAAKTVSALLKCKHLEELDVFEWEHTSVVFFFWTIIYLNETKSSTDTHQAQHKLKVYIKLLDSYFDWRKESMFLLFKEDCSLTSRLRGLYRPWIVRKVANGLQMLHSIFDQVLEVIQFTVICHHYKPFKAGPLMSKHALWQIYEYMGNTAKLSKIKEKRYTFILL